MRVTRLSSMVTFAAALCAVLLAVCACAPSDTQAPSSRSAEPQGQPVIPTPSGDVESTATSTPVPAGIRGGKDAELQVAGYLVPREGEWTVYATDPGRDGGDDASPLAALVPGTVDQAGIEAFSGSHIWAAGNASPGDDVPQIQVDEIEAAVEP